MKVRTVPRVIPFVVAAVSILSLAAFVSVRPSHADDPVMALDFATGDNGSNHVGNVQSCTEVRSGASYTVDVVLIDVTDAVASQFTLSYSGSVDADDVSMSLLNEEKPDVGGSAVIETGVSDPASDSDGSHLLSVVNDPAIGSGGASGSGVLVRLTMTAPATATPMLVSLELSRTAIADSNADAIRHSTKDAALAVAGATCQQVSPSPTVAPTPTPPGPDLPAHLRVALLAASSHNYRLPRTQRRFLAPAGPLATELARPGRSRPY
jgi:hypothetical protein